MQKEEHTVRWANDKRRSDENKQTEAHLLALGAGICRYCKTLALCGSPENTLTVGPLCCGALSKTASMMQPTLSLRSPAHLPPRLSPRASAPCKDMPARRCVVPLKCQGVEASKRRSVDASMRRCVDASIFFRFTALLFHTPPLQK